MKATPYEMQLASLILATMPLDEDTGCLSDDLIAMARQLSPLLEDAVAYYLKHGVAPEITDPQDD